MNLIVFHIFSLVKSFQLIFHSFTWNHLFYNNSIWFTHEIIFFSYHKKCVATLKVRFRTSRIQQLESWVQNIRNCNNSDFFIFSFSNLESRHKTKPREHSLCLLCVCLLPHPLLFIIFFYFFNEFHSSTTQHHTQHTFSLYIYSGTAEKRKAAREWDVETHRAAQSSRERENQNGWVHL